MTFALVFLGGASVLMFLAMIHEVAIFYWLSGWVACRGWMAFVEHIIGAAAVQSGKTGEPQP